jgi:hypothetical protein
MRLKYMDWKNKENIIRGKALQVMLIVFIYISLIIKENLN